MAGKSISKIGVSDISGRFPVFSGFVLAFSDVFLAGVGVFMCFFVFSGWIYVVLCVFRIDLCVFRCFPDGFMCF